MSGRVRNPKCRTCGHLDWRHHAGGRCEAKRSVPGGRVYPCDCREYVPPRGQPRDLTDALLDAASAKETP